MPEESPNPDCILESLPIDTTITGKGTYFQVPIFPHWLPYIGQIAFLSGALEGKWNALLEAMFLATDTKPENNWKLRKGKKTTQIIQRSGRSHLRFKNGYSQIHL